MTITSSGAVNLRSISHPVLYEVNSRVLLRDLARSEGRAVTLGSIPDSLLDTWKALGINAVWMMGIWSSGPEGIAIARQDEALRAVYRSVLPDYTDEDVAGSPYAIAAYKVPAAMGGEKGLGQFRSRLAGRGIGLVLDFVPNHTARDHSWVRSHPGFYVGGQEGDANARPDLFFRATTDEGERTIAMGRDPAFAGWTDTAQLDIRRPGTREALHELLLRIASMCDGVRCDMAMLVLESVFQRTWGFLPGDVPCAKGEFWKEAIDAIRRKYPSFLFVAEAYWNTEWDLQQLGFDFTYDKTLFDRLLHEGAGAVRDHLRAELDYQRHSLRFIENHDEQRAARVLPSESWQFAAATVVATVPGMVMFHDGQFEGRQVKLPIQLTRRPVEEVVPRTTAFYARLLEIIADPIFQNGSWRLLMPRAAWHENYSWQNFLFFWWHEYFAGTLMVVINYAPLSGQCYVDLPLDDIDAPALEFRDIITDAAYTRDKNGLSSKGMYFDLQPYGIHVFEVLASGKPSY